MQHIFFSNIYIIQSKTQSAQLPAYTTNNEFSYVLNMNSVDKVQKS